MVDLHRVARATFDRSEAVNPPPPPPPRVDVLVADAAVVFAIYSTAEPSTAPSYLRGSPMCDAIHGRKYENPIMRGTGSCCFLWETPTPFSLPLLLGCTLLTLSSRARDIVYMDLSYIFRVVAKSSTIHSLLLPRPFGASRRFRRLFLSPRFSMLISLLNSLSLFFQASFCK